MLNVVAPNQKLGTVLRFRVSYFRELAILIYFDCLFKVFHYWHCTSASFALQAKKFVLNTKQWEGERFRRV
jgi:hypothetical protein